MTATIAYAKTMLILVDDVVIFQSFYASHNVTLLRP